MKKTYNRIAKIRAMEDMSVDVSIDRKIAKFNEEFGEFCAVYLESVGYKWVSPVRPKDEVRTHILEELCDSKIMLHDIFNAFGFTEDEVDNMMNQKLDAWENKCGLRKERAQLEKETNG